MFSKSSIGRRKSAGITIEVTLSVALSVLVLFLVLGLFSDNLATMAANSGIQNLFNRNNEAAKTQPDKWGIHPTATKVEVSQVNVQVVADQGLTLEQYILQAQSKVAYYKEHPPTTQAEIEDLAKQLTILKVCNVSTNSTGASVDYSYYYKTYKIRVDIDRVEDSYKTSIDTKIITGDYDTNQVDYQLNVIKDVINKFS